MITPIGFQIPGLPPTRTYNWRLSFLWTDALDKSRIWRRRLLPSGSNLYLIHWAFLLMANWTFYLFTKHLLRMIFTLGLFIFHMLFDKSCFFLFTKHRLKTIWTLLACLFSICSWQVGLSFEVSTKPPCSSFGGVIEEFFIYCHGVKQLPVFWIEIRPLSCGDYKFC